MATTPTSPATRAARSGHGWAGSPQAGHPSITTTEPAPWSAYRDLVTPYGFASFDFVPHEPGGTTSITVTHYGAEVGSPDYTQRDQFVMRKKHA